MENIIQKIALKKYDDEVHREFTKFSKGVFNHKYLIEAKKQKTGYTIKTGAEFANFLVRACASLLTAPTEMKGVIVATFNVKEDAPFPIGGIKQFMGIKQCVVDTSVKPSDLMHLMDKQPKAFYALSFKGADFELKIKPKAPKSAKPAATGEKAPKAEFCSLKTTNEALAKSILFDVPECTQVAISHSLNITGIKLPTGVQDPVQMREQAKRQGSIIRTITIDGKETKKDYPFEA